MLYKAVNASKEFVRKFIVFFSSRFLLLVRMRVELVRITEFVQFLFLGTAERIEDKYASLKSYLFDARLVPT